MSKLKGPEASPYTARVGDSASRLLGMWANNCHSWWLPPPTGGREVSLRALKPGSVFRRLWALGEQGLTLL